MFSATNLDTPTTLIYCESSSIITSLIRLLPESRSDLNSSGVWHFWSNEKQIIKITANFTNQIDSELRIGRSNIKLVFKI